MKTVLLALCLLFCVGCSQHKLYVIGADDEQLSQLRNNLKHSGIKVIKQNNLTSDFERLTLVSAIAYPIGTVEAALDQVVHTTLAQGKNQFYTDSAGLYFPTYKPKLIDIYTNTCNNHSITFSTLEDNHFTLSIEKFIETDQGYEYITVGEFHGTYSAKDNELTAYSKQEMLFNATQFFATSIKTDGLAFKATAIEVLNGACKIFKRNNLT
jgi:hypothetical protein